VLARADRRPRRLSHALGVSELVAMGGQARRRHIRLAHRRRHTLRFCEPDSLSQARLDRPWMFPSDVRRTSSRRCPAITGTLGHLGSAKHESRLSLPPNRRLRLTTATRRREVGPLSPPVRTSRFGCPIGHDSSSAWVWAHPPLTARGSTVGSARSTPRPLAQGSRESQPWPDGSLGQRFVKRGSDRCVRGGGCRASRGPKHDYSAVGCDAAITAAPEKQRPEPDCCSRHGTHPQGGVDPRARCEDRLEQANPMQQHASFRSPFHG
jgi:hypothetical protein